MAWNPSLAVAEARDIGEKHGDDMVVVIRVHLEHGIRTATWGRTRQLCGLAAPLGDAVIDHIEEILVEVERRLARRMAEPGEE